MIATDNMVFVCVSLFRISEHALMPGLVNQYFNDEAKIIEYSKQFEQHG